jgi:hypothetical protein
MSWLLTKTAPTRLQLLIALLSIYVLGAHGLIWFLLVYSTLRIAYYLIEMKYEEKP